jgi:hypothetical protein
MYQSLQNEKKLILYRLNVATNFKFGSTHLRYQNQIYLIMGAQNKHMQLPRLLGLHKKQTMQFTFTLH